MKTLYRHGGSHKFQRQGKGKRVPEMTPEQIKARNEYVAKQFAKRAEEDRIKEQVDEELFGYKHGGKHYPHGGKHEEEEGFFKSFVNFLPRAASEVGSDAMRVLQAGYNKATGKGPQPIPAEKFESTNENYSGMDEVVDWMLEQQSQGMGPIMETNVLEKLKTGGQSKDPNAPSYMPTPSPDDIERKAMMFSNVFDAVRSNPYIGIDDRRGAGGNSTDEKRAKITEVFNEQKVPEEWQNEFFEALRSIRPGITQGGYSGKSGMEMEGLEAGPIDSGVQRPGIQGSTQTIQMPQARRRGLFRRR